MYISHIINMGTYYKELNKKIFNQLIIVDHTTPLIKFDLLGFRIKANTPTIGPLHLL
jgi:hypothetical protein